MGQTIQRRSLEVDDKLGVHLLALKHDKLPVCLLTGPGASWRLHRPRVGDDAVVGGTSCAAKMGKGIGAYSGIKTLNSEQKWFGKARHGDEQHILM